MKKWILLFILLTPLLIAANPMQANQPIPDAVLLIIPALTGGLAVPLVNFLKQVLGWTKPADKIKNTWLSFGVSIGISALALWITRSFVPYNGDPTTIVGWLTVTFSVATMVYKHINQPDTAQG